MSSFAVQSIANFIVRALAKIGIKTFMYLDDILMVAHSREQAARHYGPTIDLLGALGLKVASHELQPLSRLVTWLGICFSLDENSISIPADKVGQIQNCLVAAARKTKITKRHLQSILGFLNHVAKVVRAARVFVARLLAALRATTGNVVNVTDHIRADLAWFARYLRTENTKAILPHGRTVLRIWADSCLEGGGRH